MGKRYTAEERAQALKLAEEISRAARQLWINEDTLYGWRSRERKRTTAQERAVGRRSEEELIGGLCQDFTFAKKS